MDQERAPQNELHEYRENVRDYSEFPYDKLDAKTVNYIVDDAIERCLELAQKIVETDELTYDTTMGRLVKIGSLQEHAYGKACFMGSVHPDKDVREAAEEALLRLFRETSKIYFNPTLYEKLVAYQDTDEGWNLGGERGGGLSGTITYLEQIGHGLPKKKRDFVFEQYQQIVENEIKFQRNIDNDKTIVPVSLEGLAGMPQSFIDELEKDEDGNYKITMQYPHVHPILALCDDRETRRKVKQAFDSRAKNPNYDLLKETVHLRYSVARKLGYVGWSQYILDDETYTMAESPRAVQEFHDELLYYMTDKEAEEIEIMTNLLHADGYEGPLKSYDFAYYENRARKEKYPIDDAEIAEYFPIDAVMEGMFNLHEQLYGIKYRKVEIPVWNDDVLAYAIDDVQTGEELGILYYDLYPREGKYSHAATFPLRYGYIRPDGTRQRPEAAIVCNFSKSKLLTQKNINYLLHETGHGIHQILAQTEELTHAGFNVEWDFVEMMSQVQECWGLEPEILKTFSRHIRTSEQIPDDLVKMVTDSEKSFNVTDAVLRIARAYYDQLIHMGLPIGDFDHYMEMAKEISPFIEDEGSCFPATFQHIMGGYDALFYGYGWAKVRALQVFERFKKEGLTNPEVGRDFRKNFLEPGGTIRAHEMMKGFFKRHKRPSVKPYLRSLGVKVR